MVYRIGLFALTRLCSHLGEVGHHQHAVAREMAADSVHEALPSLLQHRGSHGLAETISAAEASVGSSSNLRSKQGFPHVKIMASAGGVRENAPVRERVATQAADIRAHRGVVLVWIVETAAQSLCAVVVA